MAAYDSVPSEKPVPPKKAKKKATPRSQMPGHPADDGHMFGELPKGLAPKKAAPVSKRQATAQSKGLDKENKPTKVAGKGTPRDSVAQGARKASTPPSKPNGTDKKVRGQVKK